MTFSPLVLASWVMMLQTSDHTQLLIWSLLNFLHLCICVSASVYMCVWDRWVWMQVRHCEWVKVRGQLVEINSPFHHVGSADETKVIREVASIFTHWTISLALTRSLYGTHRDIDRTGIVVWSHLSFQYYRERYCLKKITSYTQNQLSFMVKYLTILHTEMYITWNYQFWLL